MPCEWLEKDGDCDLYILQELFAKMEELNSENASTYSGKSLRSKLKEKYWDHIYFTNLPGRPNIVCFRDMASYILYESKRKTGEMKEFIITAAAKLIKAELRDLDKMNKVYPMFHQLSDIKDQKEWVPKSLQLLLSYLITCLKQVIIIILCYFFIIHMLLYHWNGKMSEIIFNSKKLETS